jgi:hypothetical protein
MNEEKANEPQIDVQFYSEWVEYISEEERHEAVRYLTSWKKFTFRKMPELEIVEEVLIDRPCLSKEFEDTSLLVPRATLGVKVGVSKKRI